MSLNQLRDYFLFFWQESLYLSSLLSMSGWRLPGNRKVPSHSWLAAVSRHGWSAERTVAEGNYSEPICHQSQRRSSPLVKRFQSSYHHCEDTPNGFSDFILVHFFYFWSHILENKGVKCTKSYFYFYDSVKKSDPGLFSIG